MPPDQFVGDRSRLISPPPPDASISAISLPAVDAAASYVKGPPCLSSVWPVTFDTVHCVRGRHCIDTRRPYQATWDRQITSARVPACLPASGGGHRLLRSRVALAATTLPFVTCG